MRRLAALALLTVSLSPIALAADEWPQFRGRAAGVAADDPALPDTWSATENVAWKTPIPGLGWSSPVVWGDHVFVTTVVNTGAAGAAEARVLSGRLAGADGAAPLDGLRHRLQDRQGALGARGGSARAAAGQAPEEQLRLGDRRSPTASASTSTSATLGLFAFDLNGKPLWSKPIGPFKTRNNWGTGASPVAPRRSRLHRQRQRRAVVPRRLRQADRRGGVARQPRRGHATGRRRSSGRTTGGPRSSRPARTRCAPTI